MYKNIVFLFNCSKYRYVLLKISIDISSFVKFERRWNTSGTTSTTHWISHWISHSCIRNCNISLVGYEKKCFFPLTSQSVAILELLELWPFWKIWIDLEDVPSEPKWPEQIHSIKVSAVGGRIIIFYVQFKRYSSVSNVESASFIKIKSRRGRCSG